MVTFLIIIAIIAIAIFFWIIGIYNKLIRFIEAIQNNKRQIDIQLDRRMKVFESLINVVKKYMDYEQTTLKDIVKLRNQAQSAQEQGDEKTRMQAENKISQIARGINVVFENYPDLKADKNAMQLQEEIVNTENKLAFAKQAYNDSIERYNAEKKSFFQSMVVNMFHKALDKTFEYWAITDDKRTAAEDYRVEL